jgi:hypothetical protein
MARYHSPQIATDGLVWCIDAGNTKSYPRSGTKWSDLTRNNVYGTLTNGPTFSTDGGGSILFDGSNDSVNFFPPTSIGVPLDLTSGLTLEVWFNATTFGGQNRGILIYRFDQSDSPYGYYFGVDNSITTGTNSLRYVFYSGGATRAVRVDNIVSLSTWTQGVVTHTGTSAKIYTNGILRGDFTVVGNVTGGLTGLYVGNYVNTGFEGKISIVRAYNRSLTETEVLENFNANRIRFGI